MSEEFPGEALGVPIQLSEEDSQNDELPEGSDNIPDNSALGFEENFLEYNQMKDKFGRPLATNKIYCLVRGDTSWNVLEQGSNPRQVKFTNFGRHFSVSPANGHADSRSCVLKAVNVGKYLDGFRMSGDDDTHGSSLTSSAWYFDTERRDNQGYVCYRTHTLIGAVIDGGGSMPGLPSYSSARAVLDKDNEWRSGSIKVNFDVWFAIP